LTIILPDPPSDPSESSIEQRTSVLRSDRLAQSATNVISRVCTSVGLSTEVPYRVDDAEILCSICLDGMDEEEGNLFTVPSCQHTFHIDCIAPWKKISRKCPCCRGALPDEIGPTLSKFRNLPAEEVSQNITISDIYRNIIYSPVGLAYPLCLFLLFLALETIFYNLFVVCFCFLVIYVIYHGEDIITASCRTLILCALSPLYFCAAGAFFILQILYVLYRTLRFYAKVFMCKMRWSDAFGSIIVRAINITIHFFEHLH